MSDSEKKSLETASKETERKIDVEREKLELEKQRLKLDFEVHETSKRLDAERIILDKSKQRTTTLQIGLPVLVSILALAFSYFSEARRSAATDNLQRLQLEQQRLQVEQQYNQMVNSYKEGRFELFKRLADRATSGDEIKKIYAETFPRDSTVLRNEQKEMAAK